MSTIISVETKPKYLFCVVPCIYEQGLLRLKSRELIQELGSGYTALQNEIPYHIALVPPLKTYKSFEFFSTARQALSQMYFSQVRANKLSIFNAHEQGQHPYLVMLVEKCHDLELLHENLLPVVEKYRISQDSEMSLNEQRFGSDFVGVAYTPHISLLRAPVDSSESNNLARVCAKPHTISLNNSQVKLLRKNPNMPWVVEEEYVLKN